MCNSCRAGCYCQNLYAAFTALFGGIAIGTIQVYKKGEQQVKRRKIEDVPAEIGRYRTAKQTALEQLQNLYDKALKEVGEANAAIFEIHQMMLEDDDYNESVENIIETQRVNAEYSPFFSVGTFILPFSLILRVTPLKPPFRQPVQSDTSTDSRLPVRQRCRRAVPSVYI
jgi:hypothetical protein